ncbi:MAG: hypothetical protein AAFV88_13140 [Planctomycetota bacterium]
MISERGEDVKGVMCGRTPPANGRGDARFVLEDSEVFRNPSNTDLIAE